VKIVKMRMERMVVKGTGSMRGSDIHQEGLFSYLSPESRIPKRHPLRPVREMTMHPIAPPTTGAGLIAAPFIIAFNLILELVALLAKPLSLSMSLRLFGNLFAGEQVFCPDRDSRYLAVAAAFWVGGFPPADCYTAGLYIHDVDHSLFKSGN
jgi:hypothetical protein